MASNRYKQWGGVALLVGTTLAWLAAWVWPSQTVVTVTLTPEGALGRVNGSEVALTLPPGTVPGTAVGRYLAPASTSLYFTPAEQASPLVGLGRLGEWVQMMRPAPYWDGALPASAGPGTTLTATLVGGRMAAGLVVYGDGAGNGYALVVRPERRTLGWWQVTEGVPSTALESTVYRPAFAASVADVVQELALAGLAALVLLAAVSGLALVGGRGLRRVTLPVLRPRPPALRRLPVGVLPALGFAVAGLVLTLAVGLGPLEGIPHVQDDAAYLWQARVFAGGHAWVPAPPGPEFFEHGFVLITDGRWFAKYPPGWPLLLALGVILGVPWLVNPLCAGASLALVYWVGRQLFGPVSAFWAALLGLLSPFFLFMSGSYMAHPATLLAVLLATALFVRLMTTPRLRFRPLRPTALALSLGTGIALGWAFISREATALGLALPFIGAGVGAAWGTARALGRRKPQPWRRLVPYALMALGGVGPLLLLGLVNWSEMGSPFRLAQELVGSYDRLGFGPGYGPEDGGHSPALGLYNALVYGRTLAQVLFGWPPPFTFAPLVLALGALVGQPWRQARWLWFCVAAVAGLGAVYFAWWSATTIYGPRYWYEASPFLWLLAGQGIARLTGAAAAAARRAGATRPAARMIGATVPGLVVGVLVLYNVTQFLPAQVRAYTAYNGIDASSLRRVAAAGLDHALVFVALQPAYPRRDYGKVFFANDPLLGGPVVYVRDLGAERNRGLVPAFPGRTPYYLPLDGPPVLGVGP